MADNFDLKKFLFENKLGSYSRLKEEKFYAPNYIKQKYGDKAKEIEANIEDEEDNNPNIWDVYTSLETPEETDEFVQGFMNESENIEENEDNLNELRDRSKDYYSLVDLYYFEDLDMIARKEDVDPSFHDNATLYLKGDEFIKYGTDKWNKVDKYKKAGKIKDDFKWVRLSKHLTPGEIDLTKSLSGVKPTPKTKYGREDITTLMKKTFRDRFADEDDLINEESNETVDIRALVSLINDAKKAGKEIAVDGEPMTMWIASIGRIKTANSTYNVIHDIASGDSKLSIDGEEIILPKSSPKPQSPRIDTRSPEQKKKDLDAWMDRYGPGGGYDLPTGGRRTFDEGLSIDAMDRMDGLVNQPAIRMLINGAQAIIKDLKADGFDDEDIFDYIMERIKVLA